MYQKTKHSKKQSISSRTLGAFIAVGIMAAPLLPTGIVHANEGDNMHDKSGSPSTSMSMPMDNKTMSPGSQALHESMMKGMKDMESMSMMGDTDQDFAMMMIQHHKAALNMTQIELKHGKDAKLRSMAKKIIASQKEEIKQFERWMERHN